VQTPRFHEIQNDLKLLNDPLCEGKKTMLNTWVIEKPNIKHRVPV
jgi:hypothetical protein